MREAHRPPGRDLRLRDRRRGRSARLHGGGRARGDHVIAAEQRNRAVILAPAEQRHRQGRRLTERATDRRCLDRRPDQTTRVAHRSRSRRAIPPPIDDGPVVHAVSLPPLSSCDPHDVLPVVRRVSRKNPRGARVQTYDHRVSCEEQIRSDQHRERGATPQCRRKVPRWRECNLVRARRCLDLEQAQAPPFPQTRSRAQRTRGPERRFRSSPQLWAPHNRRLLTDDRGFAAAPPRTGAAVCRRGFGSVDRKRPQYFRERGEVRRGGISGLELRREGRGGRRATRARRFGVLRCLDVRACDFHRVCARAGRGARAR